MKLLPALTFALCAAGVLGLGQAAAEAPQQTDRQYVVIRENAHIPFARQVNSWEVADDHSLLLRVGANHWYRAEIDQFCARNLRFETRVALFERGAGSIDRFGQVRLRDGTRCHFQSLDEIENPHVAVASR